MPTDIKAEQKKLTEFLKIHAPDKVHTAEKTVEHYAAMGPDGIDKMWRLVNKTFVKGGAAGAPAAPSASPSPSPKRSASTAKKPAEGGPAAAPSAPQLNMRMDEQPASPSPKRAASSAKKSAEPSASSVAAESPPSMAKKASSKKAAAPAAAAAPPPAAPEPEEPSPNLKASKSKKSMRKAPDDGVKSDDGMSKAPQPPSRGSALSQAELEQQRVRLSNFFQRVDPRKLGNVDEIIRQLAEEDDPQSFTLLWASLERKYGPEAVAASKGPSSSSSQPPAGKAVAKSMQAEYNSSSSMRDIEAQAVTLRLKKFFESRDKSKTMKEIELMVAEAAKEPNGFQELWERTQREYGAEDAGPVPSSVKKFMRSESPGEEEKPAASGATPAVQNAQPVTSEQRPGTSPLNSPSVVPAAPPPSTATSNAPPGTSPVSPLVIPPAAQQQQQPSSSLLKPDPPAQAPGGPKAVATIPLFVGGKSLGTGQKKKPWFADEDEGQQQQYRDPRAIATPQFTIRANPQPHGSSGNGLRPSGASIDGVEDAEVIGVIVLKADAGALTGASETGKYAFCRALEAEISWNINCMPSQVDVVRIMPGFAVEFKLQVLSSHGNRFDSLANTAPIHPGETLVQKIRHGTFSTRLISDSYHRDLGGEAITVKVLSGAVYRASVSASYFGNQHPLHKKGSPQRHVVEAPPPPQQHENGGPGASSGDVAGPLFTSGPSNSNGAAALLRPSQQEAAMRHEQPVDSKTPPEGSQPEATAARRHPVDLHQLGAQRLIQAAESAAPQEHGIARRDETNNRRPVPKEQRRDDDAAAGYYYEDPIKASDALRNTAPGDQQRRDPTATATVMNVLSSESRAVNNNNSNKYAMPQDTKSFYPQRAAPPPRESGGPGGYFRASDQSAPMNAELRSDFTRELWNDQARHEKYEPRDETAQYALHQRAVTTIHDWRDTVDPPELPKSVAHMVNQRPLDKPIESPYMTADGRDKLPSAMVPKFAELLVERPEHSGGAADFEPQERLVDFGRAQGGRLQSTDIGTRRKITGATEPPFNSNSRVSNGMPRGEVLGMRDPHVGRPQRTSYEPNGAVPPRRSDFPGGSSDNNRFADAVHSGHTMDRLQKGYYGPVGTEERVYTNSRLQRADDIRQQLQQPSYYPSGGAYNVAPQQQSAPRGVGSALPGTRFYSQHQPTQVVQAEPMPQATYRGGLIPVAQASSAQRAPAASRQTLTKDPQREDLANQFTQIVRSLEH